MPTKVAVASGESQLVDQLRSKCPDVDFVSDEVAGADIVLFSTASRVSLRARGVSNEFDVDRVAFLAHPADFLRLAAEVSNLRERIAHLERRLHLADRLQELTTFSEAEDAYERMTQTALSLLHLQYGTLLLLDSRLERFAPAFNNDPKFVDKGDYLPGIPPTLLHSSAEDYSFGRQSDLVAFPIQLGDEMFGVLRVPLPPGRNVDEERLRDVAEYVHAASPILASFYQLTRSNELVLRDDLTKAFNRRFFDSYLEEEIVRSKRYTAVFSIIFLDLDDLKNINNKHGHLTGSRTLQEVAKRIMSAVRGIDKVVRFGGDEFCIILPQTEEDQAAAVAMRVRKALIEAPFDIEEGVRVNITASFGIATFPTHASTKENLIRQADAAMFRVKSTTKNAIGTADVEAAEM